MARRYFRRKNFRRFSFRAKRVFKRLIRGGRRYGYRRSRMYGYRRRYR